MSIFQAAMWQIGQLDGVIMWSATLELQACDTILFLQDDDSELMGFLQVPELFQDPFYCK